MEIDKPFFFDAVQKEKIELIVDEIIAHTKNMPMNLSREGSMG